MKFFKSSTLWLSLIILLSVSFLSAAMIEGEQGFSKALDLNSYHNVGNIWLRVSNYGFFGSGSAITPPWPSLEYPGGSGVDYLYQGALWFGAKKVRKSATGEVFYWRNFPPRDNDDYITQAHPDWNANLRVVVDTLVTVGFDGDRSLYEFLPAYNTLEYNTPGYSTHNLMDKIITQSTRTQRRGFDDDGDGLIDEDPVGRNFPFRTVVDGYELPAVFHDFSGKFIHELREEGIDGTGIILNNLDIWYPLGFQDLSYIDPTNLYNFAEPFDDDRDGLVDEDGAPVSEQDYISYYYDYSPFGTAGQRDYGSSASMNDHIPLNIRVRQMSYQWSYDYIKNLVYVEFNVTNMNPNDILYDCAMGIYMDADVGPQSFDATARASDDKSGYVRGKGYEFAFTFDADFDGGLTPGYLGARVCTPDPDTLEFACWYWKVGDGPDDFQPTNYTNLGARKTANEKYWLLTGRNPDDRKFQSLRKTPQEHADPVYIQEQPVDTRFLFAFFGDQQGYDAPTESSWNLKPFETMKIVIALFPGNTIDELKRSALWAKNIYGQAQNLQTVVLPDTFPHYNPPEPPEFPRMFSELKEQTPNNISLDVYWDNRSEFSIDYILVQRSQLGWNHRTGLDSDSTVVNMNDVPPIFRPGAAQGPRNENAIINPYTAWRLRHDFQGYSLWGRSGRGDSDSWVLQERWDRIETDLDRQDYLVNYGTESFIDLGGDLGIDKGLPQPTLIDESHIAENGLFNGYYILGEDFLSRPIEVGDVVYGKPLYSKITAEEARSVAIIVPDGAFLTDDQRQQNQLLFKHPLIRDDVFLALVDDNLIPLPGHLGQNKVDDFGVEFLSDRQTRLTRRYYTSTINNLPKGREYYVSVTTFDRGMPSEKLGPLESGKDANMEVYFPGPLAKNNMDNIYVVPNPYRGSSSFDGRIDGDSKGDKSRRLWFVNLPERCNVQIYTLAGDLVDEFEHNGAMEQDIISISKAAAFGVAASGIHPWNLLSKNNQIIASGLYFFSVKDHRTGDVKVGKFAVIR